MRGWYLLPCRLSTVNLLRFALHHSRAVASRRLFTASPEFHYAKQLTFNA
jgi:hypothetical protein